MAGNNVADKPSIPNESADEKSEKYRFTNQAELVQNLINGACEIDKTTGKTVRKDGSKITTADLIRLLQFQREIAKERPVDIVEMRWIDSPKS
jgi:hypothetical protein